MNAPLKKRIIVILIGIVVFFGISIAALFSLRLLLGGSEDTWICENGQWVVHGKPSAGKPSTPCQQETLNLGNPRDVVESFYTWYITQEENPLTTEAYRERPELSEELIKVIEEKVRSLEEGSYDPFLDSQEMPEEVEAQDEEVTQDTASVTLIEHFTGFDHLLTVSLVKNEAAWKIVAITPQSEITSSLTTGSKKAMVFFSNPKKAGVIEENCGLVYGVERSVPRAAGYDALITELFRGPTAQERANGYTSLFSEKTATLLKKIKVVGSTAYINLTDFREILPDAQTSCGGKQFFTQIETTLKSDKKIQKIVYAIEGEPQKFYDFMQIGCAPREICDPAPFK